jgi:hypothetical protein
MAASSGRERLLRRDRNCRVFNRRARRSVVLLWKPQPDGNASFFYGGDAAFYVIILEAASNAHPAASLTQAAFLNEPLAEILTRRLTAPLVVSAAYKKTAPLRGRSLAP